MNCFLSLSISLSLSFSLSAVSFGRLVGILFNRRLFLHRQFGRVAHRHQHQIPCQFHSWWEFAKRRHHKKSIRGDLFGLLQPLRAFLEVMAVFWFHPKPFFYFHNCRSRDATRDNVRMRKRKLQLQLFQVLRSHWISAKLEFHGAKRVNLRRHRPR